MKRYGYTNVDAFMQVYRATKKVKDSYERKLADWNDKYGQYAESDAKPRKSTLMRLLLGFETPQKGLITYDKKDIMKLDTASLRKKIGVVLQDGKLFMGDIYSNIVISAPQLTVEDAWKAAEIASIADDIREMPMGMRTIIGEGQGGISGGQKQRLMRAESLNQELMIN